jgi:predicted phosphodiesterase
MKTCPKCSLEQPFSSFSKNTKAKDGYQHWCKKCMKEWKDQPKVKEGIKEYEQRVYRKRLELAKTFGTPQTAHLETQEPFIDLWLRFDNHYGHMECDVFTLNKYIQWSKAPHVYQFLGGDVIENVPTTPDKIKHLLTQTIHPLKQISDLRHTLDRALCYLIGNHEGRSGKIDLSLDSGLITMLQSKNIPVLEENNHIYTLNVNQIQYTFLLSHGWGGSQTPEYVIKKMLYDQLVPDQVDFIVVGHTHHNVPEVPRDRAILTNEYIATKRVIGIRPGSFLYNPSYLKYGRETISGNVILRLSTKKWNYRLFENLQALEETDL